MVKRSFGGSGIGLSRGTIGDELFALGRVFLFSTGFQTLKSADGEQVLLVLQNGSAYGTFLGGLTVSMEDAVVPGSRVKTRLIYNPPPFSAPQVVVPFALNRQKVSGFKGKVSGTDGSTQAGPFPVGVVNVQSLTVLEGLVPDKELALVLAQGDVFVVSGELSGTPTAQVAVSMIGCHV